MPFLPQYSAWGKEEFASAEGATIVNTGEFGIVGGVTRLIPIVFISGTHSFNAPWDPVSGWDMQNNMDSDLIIEQNLIIDDDGDGVHGNISTSYRTAYYTSGEHSNVVYHIASGAEVNKMTVEFGARTPAINGLDDYAPYQGEALNGLGLPYAYTAGSSHHGVFISNHTSSAFIEIHPKGLNLRGVSGAFLLADYASRVVNTRIVLDGNAITMMTTDDQHMYAASGAITYTGVYDNPGIQSGNYVAFGSYSPTARSEYGSNTLNLTGNYAWMESQNVTGWYGHTMWDDIKIATGQAVTRLASDYIPNYPVGTKTIYTDDWVPSEGLTQYLGAYINYNPISGGTTTVTLQSNVSLGTGINGGSFGNTTFEDVASVDPLVITSDERFAAFMDIGSTKIQAYPFSNALRFKIESLSNGGGAPEIDTISIIGRSPNAEVDIVPNWKMSSFAKDIYFLMDDEDYDRKIPQADHDDMVYLHNDLGHDSVQVDSYITPHVQGNVYNVVSGEVVIHTGSYDVGETTLGLAKVNDGHYKDAWRNFNITGRYSSEWQTDSRRAIGDSIFNGDLLDNFTTYPVAGSGVTTGTFANIVYDVIDAIDLDGTSVAAQKCLVANYHRTDLPAIHNEQPIGFKLGLGIPITQGVQNQFGIIEGTIEIPRGPGIVVTIHEGDSTHKTHLNGENYRTPTKFSCAAYYTGNHSTATSFVGDTFVSFGALPRETQPVLPDPSIWGEKWRDNIREHLHTEFIIYDLTGYMADHCYVKYSGISANDVKTIKDLSIDYLDWPHTQVGGTSYISKNINGVNETYAANGGYTPLHRNSLVFEGWFRPLGIREDYASGEVILAKATDDNGEGVKVFLTRSGEIKATVDTSFHDGVTGKLNDGVSPTISYTLSSDKHRISWGNWNHIGVVLETSALGDKDEPSSFPMFPSWDNATTSSHTLDSTTPGERRNSPIYHAAKQAKLYLEVNKHLTAQAEVEGPAYTRYYAEVSDLGAQIPRKTLYLQDWPKIPRFAGTGNFTVTIGENVFCDFDHVRFGVKNHAEFLTDLLTKGSKATPPLISPQDALGALPANTGDSSYLELMHIYRMDHPIDYVGLDDGLATNHALVVGTTGHELLDSYELSPEFFIERVDGPKGRPAVSIGPGARIESPWTSIDEKVFNGSGSFDKDHVQLYSTIADIGGASYNDYIASQDYQHSRYNANSHIKLSCAVNIPKFPSTGIMDILTFDENPGIHAYGSGQVYLGVNSDGEIVAGTRYNFAYDIGPLPPKANRTTLTTGIWTSVGLDFAARHPYSKATGDTLQLLSPGDENFLTLYKDGTEVYTTGLVIDLAGNTSITGGFPIGYGGFLDGESNKSVYRIGGDLPRDQPSYSWTQRYNEYSVADWVIGYGIDYLTGDDVSRWSWSGVHGLEQMDKQEELAIVGGATISSVSGSNGYYTGHMIYPATVYSDAGEQIMWVTANHGNAHEGLLAKGISVFDDGIFLNAKSYYAQYENDNSQEILGSTDSPIQIGNKVPNEGVNLALVNVGNWTTDRSISLFDMSDDNPNNITQKVHGDTLLTIGTSGALGFAIADAVTSDDLRISSVMLAENGNPNKFPGYYMHFIGVPSKSVYIDGADAHADAATDQEAYIRNLNKVKDAIQFRYANGDDIPFNVFPRSIYISPYSTTSDLNLATGSLLGHSGIVTSEANSDDMFTALVITHKQTIGDSVFIHYPSRDYETDAINLQDTEIYNPVPLSKEILYPQNMNGAYVVNSGYYSTRLGLGLNSFDINLWHAGTGAFYSNTTSLL